MGVVIKDITYTDLNGDPQMERAWFRLSALELNELNDMYDGKTDKLLDKAIKNKDTSFIAKYLKDVIVLAYGVKSEDGKKLVKTPEIREAFDGSLAFDEIYTELLLNPEEVERFIEGITPKEVMEQAKEFKNANDYCSRRRVI